MTKESHRNRKLNTAMSTKVITRSNCIIRSIIAYFTWKYFAQNCDEQLSY
jgi:hypothetical protein